MRALPVVPLADASVEEAGGKGANLVRMARAGLPLPRAWILPARAYVAFLEHHGLLVRARGADAAEHARLAALVPTLALPFEVPVLAARLAVRSSAGDEDGREGSLAGAYRTELDVPPEGVGNAILRCWASWHLARAHAGAGASGSEPDMALVLMAMVAPRTAGVMFTMNPLTGSWAEMVVEAVWGLGESLVSGKAVPDRYIVRRPRGWAAHVAVPGWTQEGVAARVGIGRALATRGLAVVSETVVEQREGVRRAEAGGTEAFRVAAPGARKLLREDIVALAALGLRVEAALGGPQDVEWVQEPGGGFVLVQARPVTARQELPRGGEALWTRRFVGERWPHGATPLGWSFMEPLLAHFVGYPATSARYLGGEPPFRLVRGHPYVNVTVLRHLAFKLPGAPPPRFLLDFFPPEEETRWVRRTAAPPDLRVYAAILGETLAERRWERFRWNPVTNPAAWDDFRASLDARLAELAGAPPERALAVAGPILRAYVGIHVTSLLYANLAWELLAPRLGEDAETLLQPDGEGTITGRVNAELRALGELAVAEGSFLGAGAVAPATPPATVVLQATGERGPHTEAQRHRENASPAVGSRAEAALAAFLAAHGHRSSASWEVWSPRWAEDPAAVLALARSMADGVAGPWPREVSGEALRRGRAPSAPKSVPERIAALPPGLRGATELARTYLRLREEQRYHLDRVLWVLKQKLRQLGARWLEDPEQVRFLTVHELAAAVEGHLAVAELRATVLRRAGEVVDPAPPDFLRGDAALPVPETGGTRWQGLGISPGVARGRVRVLHGPGEAERLRAGEILVTSATDPGWTPLFSRAGGLVLEMGSQLSHGAVVAREMRLPAVANLPGATRRLRDGEEIVLDGRSGVVWRVA